MKTFEEEYRDLIVWLQSEHEKIDAQDIPWEGGFDGEKALLERRLGEEYRRRLEKLHEKYQR